MADLTTLLHIGYHKTGTSWLQQRLFVSREVGFVTPWNSMVLADALILPNDLEFEPGVARRVFDVELDRSAAEGLVPVVTWERLSGSPHAGGFDSAAIARRLQNVFPEGRVLIVTREQRSMIYALYQQYVRDGGVATLQGYLQPRNPAEMPQFRFEHLAYDRLVGLYLRLFGEDRVLVLPYESLRSDPQAFVSQIVEFAGVTGRPHFGGQEAENVSFNAATITLKRQANRWFVRNSLSPGARYYVKNHEHRFQRLDQTLPAWLGGRRARRWREQIETMVGSRYAESNHRLQAMMPQARLARLGYDLGADATGA